MIQRTGARIGEVANAATNLGAATRALAEDRPRDAVGYLNLAIHQLKGITEQLAEDVELAEW